MQNTTEHYDVIILGAGAAGLMCAFTAAQRGRRVLVVEKANKVGKKILMSGGGRCNFTNLYVEADNYIGGNPHFCKSALSCYTQWDFIAMVNRHGIAYEERKHGQLFCIESAKDILDMLLAECSSAGVTILSKCDVISAGRKNPGEVALPDSSEQAPGGYKVSMTSNGTDSALHCDSLVVATGALSIPTLGGSAMGYDIARNFGLTLTERRAGLVPFMFSDSTLQMCERLSGVSLPVEASCAGRLFSEDLLFTHRGISGPAILQISNYWHPGDPVSINLLPDLEAVDWLLAARDSHGKSQLSTLLNRKLIRSLVAELQSLWWPERADSPLAEFSNRELQTIGQHLNNWQLRPSASEGYRTAEVTLGGIDTDGISSKTMEAKKTTGLYFIGEVVDVTGHLGGFNFQWAWSSGYCAGSYA